MRKVALKRGCHLADYGYRKDRAVGRYVQNTAPILADAAMLRGETPGKFTAYDLDMGFQFASIPKILWLRIQQLGIQDDMRAIIRFLQLHKAATGEDYFTTTKTF